jgi:hypothetical protein
MKAQKVQALAIGFAAALVVSCRQFGSPDQLPSPSALLPNPCGAAGNVEAHVTLPAGITFWDVFPEAGLAPELDGVQGLELVVFAGDVTVSNIGGMPNIPPQTTLHNAVCVIMPDGTSNLYSDVPRQGMALPSVLPAP